MCGKDADKATKDQVRNNLEAAKKIATKKWGIYRLADGKFSGSGYGWKIEDEPKESDIDDNICVKGKSKLLMYHVFCIQCLLLTS